MASRRLPSRKRSDITDQKEKAAFETLEKEASTTFGAPGQSPFIYKDSRGALVGPFPFFLAAPEAGTHLLGLFRKLGAIPGLPAEAREVIILAVGAHYQAPYELYAHEAVAKEKVKMEAEVVSAISKGEKPGALSEECGLAYDAAKWLLERPGKLSDELWDRCVGTFGREGTVALAHYVGAYAYTCIVLNAMDAPVPE